MTPLPLKHMNWNWSSNYIWLSLTAENVLYRWVGRSLLADPSPEPERYLSKNSASCSILSWSSHKQRYTFRKHSNNGLSFLRIDSSDLDCWNSFNNTRDSMVLSHNSYVYGFYRIWVKSALMSLLCILSSSKMFGKGFY